MTLKHVSGALAIFNYMKIEKSLWIGCIVLQIHQRVKILQISVISAPGFNLVVMLKSHSFAQLLTVLYVNKIDIQMDVMAFEK